MGNWQGKGAVVLSVLLLFCSSLTVLAEEIEPAGHHIYDVQEAEVSDTWYGIARGNYLEAAISKLTQGSSGNALCNGYTMAHFDCDRVYIRIYLDESDNGKDGWHTLDYWTGITENGAVAAVKSGPYKVTGDKYYRVKGVHSVTQGELTETTGTCTNALFFDKP